MSTNCFYNQKREEALKITPSFPPEAQLKWVATSTLKGELPGAQQVCPQTSGAVPLTRLPVAELCPPNISMQGSDPRG